MLILDAVWNVSSRCESLSLAGMPACISADAVRTLLGFTWEPSDFVPLSHCKDRLVTDCPGVANAVVSTKKKNLLSSNKNFNHILL